MLGKSGDYPGYGKYQVGSATFGYLDELTYYAFALRSTWNLEDQDAIADNDDDAIRLNYIA
ncbi:hypothetical protein DIJ64_13065 [Mycobacterium leprae]|uniref:U1740ac n=1 Tax=Mycobacterium leprae TaxID=1769 RepID=Q50087_MYCLR|nr:hypothetical protein [Mycobacterium leprae]AAA62999.1 u1740ac [Mycobacterium leprae]AWV48655.1 hypothetical protein DIJ64_13065 [Mycobacterium leprae]OAR19620.1 hypothetical protein A8144_13915 [Mycobacterium leprae 3125609]OAX70130.1 hypothetical protein A3216_13820 [Mycobacterium leprae 7935681]